MCTSSKEDTRPQGVNEPLSKMTDAISWRNYNIFTVTHHRVSSTLWIAGEWCLTAVRLMFQTEVTKLLSWAREQRNLFMSGALFPSGSSRLQLYHKHHHHRFTPHSCLYQFIQHVIEVYLANSIAVYTIYVSQQNSTIACIKFAQALMRNCRCPPRTNVVLTSKWWISNTNVLPRSLVLVSHYDDVLWCVTRKTQECGWDKWDVSHTECPGKFSLIPWANGVAPLKCNARISVLFIVTPVTALVNNLV